MKKCGKCKKKLPEEQFAWKCKGKGRRQSYCRACQVKYRRQHYLENKEKYIEKAAEWKKESLNWFRQLKDKPCMDCKQSYPYYVMHFHHRDEENKKFDLGKGIHRFSKNKVLKEINKCDLVCANCHAIRTHGSKRV